MSKKKLESRKRRAARVRAKIFGTAMKPRLTIFRSLSEIYVQAIDDEKQMTVAAYDSRALKGKKKGLECAEAIGGAIAEELAKKGVKNAVFDRKGYRYHGKVKALAEGARKGGLVF